MHRSFKVGVFDSGIGGLNVLSACIRLAPHLNYYYIGDNKHAPYGNKSCEEIYYRVSCAVELFKLIGIDAVVLGCNTATAVCVQRLREVCFPDYRNGACRCSGGALVSSSACNLYASHGGKCSLKRTDCTISECFFHRCAHAEACRRN